MKLGTVSRYKNEVRSEHRILNAVRSAFGVRCDGDVLVVRLLIRATKRKVMRQNYAFGNKKLHTRWSLLFVEELGLCLLLLLCCLLGGLLRLLLCCHSYGS